MDSLTKLRMSCLFLALAVLAGVTESVIAVATRVSAGTLSPQWPLQIGVHLLVYLAASVLIALTWRRNRVARWALLILLGAIGTASLVVPMIAELAAGHSLGQALGGDTSPLFAFLRMAHIVLVVIGSAVLLAYRPAPVDSQSREVVLVDR